MSDLNVNSNLPAVAGGHSVPMTLPDPKEDDSFIAEFAVMDLTPLKPHTYFVAVNAGDRNKGKFLTTTLRGPYDFLEMVQEVGFMYESQQHHAKVIIAEKDRMKPVKYLDFKTTDYLEAHYQNVIADSVLEEILGGNPNYTHVAGFIETPIEEDPVRMIAQKAEENKAAVEKELKGNTDDDEDL